MLQLEIGLRECGAAAAYGMQYERLICVRSYNLSAIDKRSKCKWRMNVLNGRVQHTKMCFSIVPYVVVRTNT